jgi:hypothetical protein
MFSSHELLSIIIAVFAITTDVFVGFLGFISYRGKKIVNYLFLGLFLQSAWVALWVGLFHGGILKNNLQLYGGSQIISGFYGPFILLYTLALFNNEEKVPKKIYSIFIFGIFGTLFSIVIFNSTNAEILQMMEFKKVSFSQIDFGKAPIAAYLYLFHALEIWAFIFTSIVYAIYKFVKTKNRMEQFQAFYIFLPLVTSLMGSFMIHFIDYFYPGLETQRFGALVSLPSTLLIYLSLNHKNKMIEATFKKNRAIENELEKQKDRTSVV